MNRRDLLRQSALATAALATRSRAQTATAPIPNPAIKRILLVTKCHLDVGFTDTQHNVVQKYYNVYYPAAIALAAQLRTAPANQHSPRYTWTTGSWLLYTYLEQATSAQRKTMEQAIASGDIAWHALPFSWQTELLPRSMIDGGLSFSHELDRRFGAKTTGAKMTDVPGHTRGLIAPLVAAGVTLLDIGVNAASTPPEVPDVFRWQNHAGQSITVLYHRHDYGSTLPIPGSDLAISVVVKNDNGGPHTLPELQAIYARLHAEYPNATIQAASLTQVANAVQPHAKHLPVVTGEIGDTWIYGIPSDPLKVARFRELTRLRDEWLAAGKLNSGDAIDRAYLQHLLLSAEHTWGTDTKTYLDYQHYRPADLAAAEAAHLPGYAKMETSWQEKRDNITAAIATLPTPLQTQANTRLTSLATPHIVQESNRGAAAGDSPIVLESNELRITIDPRTAAITSLMDKRSNREWASPTHPIALITYQTLSAADFENFIARYITIQSDWAPKDFGKPEIACFDARATEHQPHVIRAAISPLPDPRRSYNVNGMQFGTGPEPVPGTRLFLELAFGGASFRSSQEPPSQAGCPVDPRARGGPVFSPSTDLGLPRQAFLEITALLPHLGPASIHFTLTILDKPANRLPEALWLTFNPVAPDPAGWLLTKSSEPVLPAEVLRGGGRNMHAVTGPIRYADPHGALTLTSLDAPVVALGRRSPLNYSPDLPNLADGLHVSLFNNAWGTNYPQWASGDWQYRFTLTLT